MALPEIVDEITNSKFNLYLLTIALIVIIIGILPLLGFLKVSSSVRTLQVVVSIITSLILAVLYQQMKEIQDSQREIMVEQQSPHIVVNHVWFERDQPIMDDVIESNLPEYSEPSTYSIDILNVDLENQGKGSAHNMRVYSNLTVEVDGEVEIASLRRPLDSVDNQGRISLPTSDTKIRGNYKNHIDSGVKGSFSGSLWYTIHDGDAPINVPFEYLCEFLYDSSVRTGTIELFVSYEDSIGNTSDICILRCEVEILPDATLAKCLAAGDRQTLQSHIEDIHPEVIASTEDLAGSA